MKCHTGSNEHLYQKKAQKRKQIQQQTSDRVMAGGLLFLAVLFWNT